jgi:small subunit ribosomal protein S17
MSSNIWNLSHPLRTGFIKLAPYGKELYGTVVKQGLNDKTVSVRISSYHWNYKVGFWVTKSKNLHCHDEENYCRTGDKVVIQSCRKMSPTKHYFVRNIVLAAGRQNLYTKDMSKYEKEAMDYNRRLRARLPKIYV